MTNLVVALTVVLQSIIGVGLGVATPARIKIVSEDIVEVVKSDFAAKKLKSNLVFKDAVAMVAAVAAHESGLRMSVENCYHNGDEGRSLGLGQVMRGPNWEGHTQKEICGNRKLQLQLALHVLDRCWEKTPTHEATFRCYAAGDAKVFSSSSRNEHALFKRILKNLDKDDGTSKDSSKHLSQTPALNNKTANVASTSQSVMSQTTVEKVNNQSVKVNPQHAKSIISNESKHTVLTKTSSTEEKNKTK